MSVERYYRVPKGTSVNVVDRKGVLHKHILKDKMEFWPGFDKSKKGARQTLIGEVHLDPIGSIGETHYNLTFYIPGAGTARTKITAQHLANKENRVIFTTGNEEWPYVVVGAEWVSVHCVGPFDAVAFKNCPEGAGE